MAKMDGTKRDEFICGFAAAVATLAREHGSPSMAADIMNTNGLTFKDFQKAGVEEFDLKPLREECKQQKRAEKKYAGEIANA